MAAGGMKVPAIIAASVICFAAGVAVGVVAAAAIRSAVWDAPAITVNEAPPGGEAKGGGMGKGMGKMGFAGAAKGGFGGGANAKSQLVALVTKLDQLTAKPLAVRLSDEQRAKLREQLQGLAEMEELDDEDAEKRLNAVLEIVKGERETLEAAGYRWPGQGAGWRLPADAPNPFSHEENGKHLKSLQEHLTKAGSP